MNAALQINAQYLAALVWGVDVSKVLAASYVDGGLVAVLDEGIRGCPKFVMDKAATDAARSRYKVPVTEGEELRGTFGSDGVQVAGYESQVAGHESQVAGSGSQADVGPFFAENGEIEEGPAPATEKPKRKKTKKG